MGFRVLGLGSRFGGCLLGGVRKLVLRDNSCITQLKAQGPSRSCNESQEEEEDNELAGPGPDSPPTTSYLCLSKTPKPLIGGWGLPPRRGGNPPPPMVFGLRVRRFGFRVSGSGFRISGRGFGVWGLGFGVWGSGFGVCLPGGDARRNVQGFRGGLVFKAHRLPRRARIQDS